MSILETEPGIWAIRIAYSPGFGLYAMRIARPRFALNEKRKSDFLSWRGGEGTARHVVQKLKSALGEYERRKTLVAQWHATRRAEILAEEGVA